MTGQEWYAYGQEHCRIERGDTVKVLRIAKNEENGWGTGWVPNMDKSIGKILTVEEDRQLKGFRLSDGYSYPFFVLELIRKGPTEKILPANIADIIEISGFGCVKEPVKSLVIEILKEVRRT